MKYIQLSDALRLCVSLRYISLLAILLSGISHSYAQNIELTREQKTDSALVRAVKRYDKTIGRNSFLYTGRVYYENFGSVRGHQFFEEDYWANGEITYEGQKFDSVFLMYDIYNDEVLLEHFSSGGSLAPIKLYNPKISSFKLQDHTFIKLEEDTVSGLKEGFYDVMYSGDQLGIYALREKQISKSSNTNTYYEAFIEKERYYLKKDDLYYRIRRKKDILKLLKAHKRELKKMLRENLLSFSRDPERTLIYSAELYETL